MSEPIKVVIREVYEREGESGVYNACIGIMIVAVKTLMGQLVIPLECRDHKVKLLGEPLVGDWGSSAKTDRGEYARERKIMLQNKNLDELKEKVRQRIEAELSKLRQVVETNRRIESIREVYL